MSALREHLRRFWFRFDRPPGGALSWTGLGCGVTGVDRSDAEALLAASPLAKDGLPPVREVIEDVDVQTLDAGHVLPNMGDPSVRGVWFPRV
jgi:hypothetical protein